MNREQIQARLAEIQAQKAALEKDIKGSYDYTSRNPVRVAPDIETTTGNLSTPTSQQPTPQQQPAAQQPMSQPAPQPVEQPEYDPTGNTLKIGTGSYNIDTGIPLSGDAFNFLAGAGKGLTDVVQGVGNMVGLVDDETITNRQALDAALMDTGYGKLGEGVAEMAALAPLGAATLPLKAGATAMKAVPAATGAAGKLQKAVQMAGSTGGRGAAEAAAGGAILADPNERGEGATQGALLSGALSQLNKGVGRVFKDGLVKVSPEVRRVQELSRRAGMDDFVPVAQAADPTKGPITASTAAVYNDLMPMVPSARGMLEKQNEDLLTNANDLLLRRVFQNKKDGTGSANVASSVLRDTGDMNKAVQAGLDMKKSDPTLAQQLVKNTANNADRGVMDPTSLVKALRTQNRRDGGFVADMPMYDLANDLAAATSTGAKGSTMTARQQFNDINRRKDVGTLAGGALDLATGTALRSVTSKPVQRFLTGDSATSRSAQKISDMIDSTYSYGSGANSVNINPAELIRALKSSALASYVN